MLSVVVVSHVVNTGVHVVISTNIYIYISCDVARMRSLVDIETKRFELNANETDQLHDMNPTTQCVRHRVSALHWMTVHKRKQE